MQKASELIPIINPAFTRREQRKLLSPSQMQFVRQIDGHNSLGSLCAVLGRPIGPILKHIKTMAELEIIYLTAPPNQEPLSSSQWKTILFPQESSASAPEIPQILAPESTPIQPRPIPTPPRPIPTQPILTFPPDAPTIGEKGLKNEEKSSPLHTPIPARKTAPPQTYPPTAKTNPHFVRMSKLPSISSDELIPKEVHFVAPRATNVYSVPVLPLEEFIPEETLPTQSSEFSHVIEDEAVTQSPRSIDNLPYSIPKQGAFEPFSSPVEELTNKNPASCEKNEQKEVFVSIGRESFSDLYATDALPTQEDIREDFQREQTPPYSFGGLPAVPQENLSEINLHNNQVPPLKKQRPLPNPVEVLYKKIPDKERVKKLTAEFEKYTHNTKEAPENEEEDL